MPLPSTILVTVKKPLVTGYLAQWPRHNTVETNPLNVDNAWGPKGFGTVGGIAAFQIFVLFFWVDQPPYPGQPGYPQGNVGGYVRSEWIEHKLTAGEVLADTGLTVVAGQYIGVRIRSNITLRTPVWNFPNTTYGLAIEIEGEQLTRWEFFSTLLTLWNIPVDASQFRQDSYVLAQMPLSGPLEVAIRAFAVNIAPSGNLIFNLPEWEYVVYDVPVEPPPPPEPRIPPPVVPLDCSTADILLKAENETGYRWESHTEPADALYRFAKQLLSRCMASWSGNEDEDPESSTIDLSAAPPVGGFGFNFGFNFGGLGGILPGFALELAIPHFEAIWLVEARRISDGGYDRVQIVKPADKRGALDPRALIGHKIIRLIDWNTAWQGIYDQLRFRATAVHTAPADWTISLAPNAHIGPLFCRACELHMSRRLAVMRNDSLQAQSLTSELYDVTKDLISQSRSQKWVETARHLRR